MKYILTICLFYYSCKDCTPKEIPYEEEEQYEAIEEVEEQLSFYKGQGRYERIMGFSLLGTNPKMHVVLPVINTSDVGGIFRVTFTLKSSQDEMEINGQNYIRAGETFTFDMVKEINPNTFMTEVFLSTNVEPPMAKQSKKMIKTRTVIRHKLCYPCKENCNTKL